MALLLVAVLSSLAAASPFASTESAAAQEKSAPEGQMPSAALPGSSMEFIGQQVAQIRLLDFSGDPIQKDLLDTLPLKPGDRLDRQRLRECLRVLFATGRFANIEADVNPLPSGGVNLDFRTTPTYFNGRITVSGLPRGGPSEMQAIGTGRLELGADFTEDRLKESEDNILRLLRDHGYWTATVHSRLRRHPDTQLVDVEFHITAGQQARVGSLEVRGDASLTSEEAEDICKLHPGARIRENLLQRAVARLRKRYVKQHRLRAQITAGVPVFHPESNTVDFTLDVEPGPQVTIRTEGISLHRGKLKHLIPVYEEHTVDEDLLNEGRRNLRDYLQTQGYFDPVIQVNENTVEDQQRIVYLVWRGQQHKLRAIEVEGNRRFDAATLRERLQMQTVSVLLPHGRFSQAILADDLEAIRNLYRANGYLSAKVTSRVVDDYQGVVGDMKIVLHVDEGPLVRVEHLEILGLHAVSEAEIRDLINIQAGQPFSEATIAEDREVVLNYYYDRGFPAVQMESSTDFANPEHTSMNVVYAVHEGEQKFVNRVRINGVEHTRPHIVSRNVVIHDGMPLSQEKMLQSQRNLYDLSIFNEVQTAIENPEGDEKKKDVLFQLREARRWTINYGLGLEVGTGLNTGQGGSPQGQTGASPRVILDVTRINFRGRDQSLIFKSHIGGLEKRVSLSFDQPRWFDLPNWRMTVTALYDNTRDVNTFSSSREEGSVQLTQRVTKATQLFYRFAYRRVHVDPNSFPAGFSPDLLSLYSEPVRVGMPSVIFLRDTRDDPVNSTKGTYNTSDIGIASGYFGSEANFGRLLVQNASYHTFRKHWVFARSLRIGVESPYGSLGYIPLPERYFVGGSNSHRGFAINQAGPRDLYSGSPLGGNAMIVNNLELRFPPTPLPLVGNDLSFVLFHDIGNGFDTANDMWKNLVRFNQKDAASCRDVSLSANCDFSYMSQAVGGGIRYRTPIGPIRGDVGYNLNPPFFPVKEPSTGAPYYDRVRRFNFYFSIGQTF